MWVRTGIAQIRELNHESKMSVRSVEILFLVRELGEVGLWLSLLLLFLFLLDSIVVFLAQFNQRHVSDIVTDPKVRLVEFPSIHGGIGDDELRGIVLIRINSNRSHVD